jgi:DNA-binding CsgD family transcriptional regulator
VAAVAIVDLIYEAAFIPELWPKVLEHICSVGGAWGAGLIAVSPDQRFRYTATENHVPLYKQYETLSNRYENVRIGRALARRDAGFVRDVDLCTTEELAQDPIYEFVLRPVALGWTSGTVVPVPTGNLLIFDLVRETERGPFYPRELSRLDALRAHLARAALVSARLGLERARAATETLALIGLPVATLDAGGRILAANGPFELLSAQVGIGAGNRVRLANARSNQLLGNALDQVASDEKAIVRSIGIPASEGAPALVIHVLPIRRSAHDLFSTAASLLAVTPVSRPLEPLTELLNALFDLTPAEARIARAIRAGHTVETAASEIRVSQEAVRSHLKSILGKTGTARQRDLARLLAGAVASFGAGSDPIETLAAALGLTRAEARLARRIGAGENLRHSAQAEGITVQTARTRLKSIFAKTGVHRQAELAVMIANLSL